MINCMSSGLKPVTMLCLVLLLDLAFGKITLHVWQNVSDFEVLCEIWLFNIFVQCQLLNNESFLNHGSKIDNSKMEKYRVALNFCGSLIL